jgi:hypothetical protein
MRDDTDFLQRYTNVVPAGPNKWHVQCPVCKKDEVTLYRKADGNRVLLFDTEECWAAYGRADCAAKFCSHGETHT